MSSGRPPAEARPGRPPRASYPKGRRPEVLFTLQRDELSAEEQVLAATLQGRLARSRGPAGIYLNVPGIGYGVWLDDLADRHGVDVREGDGVWPLVARFRSRFTGYVLYRNGPSVNVATTVAGVTGAVALEESLEPLARRAGLRLVADVRDADDAWAWREYGHRVRRDLAVEQKPEFSAQLRDYAVMAGAYTFFDGNSAFRREVVAGLDDDAAILGWGDASNGEDGFVGPSSQAGVHTIPSDHAINVSTLSGFGIDRFEQRGSGRPPAADPDTHYVSFVLTDGDNIQWLLGDHQSSSRWFSSPHRGTFDMGWGISPSLIDLAPTVLKWYYDNQSSGPHHDRFVVGPSGGGYLYPGRYPRGELELHTERLNAAMARADLSVVQIIDFDTFPRTDLWSTYLKRPHIDGLIYLEYSRYDSHKGKVQWVHDKPVVSARTMLWEGLSGADEASVIDELNTATRNPGSTEGYSVVMVHAWSKDLGNVRTVIDGLAPHVEVVPPDALISMTARNVQR
ncbi:MAG TPA: GxGYxYP domain-containing protein [Actinopolymorphaceae bacterium]